MILRFASILLLLYLAFPLIAQQGYVKVLAPPQLDTLLKISRNNPQLQPLDGYRIQIFMESGNAAVERARVAMARFQELFPEEKAYLSFGQPYYRIRVGNFRTRIEAEGKLRQINQIFSQAFIIKDVIEPPSLPEFDFPNNEQ